MKLFDSKNEKTKTVEEEIAKMILEKEDRLVALFNVLSHLPPDLVEWFKGRLQMRQATKSYMEVDIAKTLLSCYATADIEPLN